MTDEDIVARVRDAGVVGAGGAGFPTHVKLGGRVDTVIANGAECEPLLTADRLLMARQPQEVVQGLRLAMQATGANRGIVALKEEYEDAAEALRNTTQGSSGIDFHLLGSSYPAGDEHVLVYEATGRLVPEGGIPLEVNVLVHNVGTLFNISQAQQGTPVTHRWLTVHGEVRQPKALVVPVGTALGQVIEWAGGYTMPEDEVALVVGGAMMGRVADPYDVVLKTTGGLLALPREGPVVRWMTTPLANAVRRGRSTCDQCRDCTDLCPRYLLGHELKPHEIMRSINYGLDWPTSIITAAVLCCECRLCEAYACPLGLSPMSYYRRVKQELQAAGWKNDAHRRQDLAVHPMRQYRLVPTHRLIDRLGLTKYKARSVSLDDREYVPESVRIPFAQHIGSPAQAVVDAGRTVQVGDPVGTIPEGELGANVHAAIGGIVRNVTDAYVAIEGD